MDTDPSSSPLASLRQIHHELDQLDRFGCDPQPSRCGDPTLALARVERLQADLARVREAVIHQTSPLSSGQRIALAHHVKVIAGSLGLLHKSFRKIARETVAHV